jgi:hypothetical protein
MFLRLFGFVSGLDGFVDIEVGELAVCFVAPY